MFSIFFSLGEKRQLTWQTRPGQHCSNSRARKGWTCWHVHQAIITKTCVKKKKFVNSLESNQPRSKQFFFNGLWMKINFRSCMERLNQSYNTKYLTCTLECLILSILSLNLPYQSIQLIKLKIHLTHTLRANKIPKHNVMTSIQRTLQCAKHFSHVSTI
jgi:hypothetical protein